MKSTKKRLFIALLSTLLITGIGIGMLFQPFGKNKGNPLLSNIDGNISSGNSSLGDSYPTPEKTIDAADTGSIKLSSRTDGKYFYTLQNGVWTCTFLKGVNIGLTLPTTDLNNPDISYATYTDWFNKIASMNANTIKLYTIMNPDFYRAFADYNASHMDKPLYLLQGVWFNEDDMTTIGDAYGNDESIMKSFTRAVQEATDIIHGNSTTTSYGSIQHAVYDRDISSYVVGFVLGLEWQPDFVKTTNQNHSGMTQFTGTYLSTQNASPFEIFLARVGDSLISYETKNYSQQHPVAFLNWSTTDTLHHSNEPFPEEDEVSVNTETIHPTSQYYPGLFAAIDVYPYYPEFINHQPEYLAFTGADGKSDPYRAYLRDLQSQYTVPVLIAEFGVPTSRGVAHTSSMGYNQGGISEEQQGNMVVSMAKDIALENYAGAMIFSWQDEWFKQTWNTIKYAPQNASQRGLNVESAEQCYGIVAYDPGSSQSVCYPDGDISEWSNSEPVYTGNGFSLYAKTDEAYLYLMAKLPSDYTFDDSGGDKLAIAISLTGHGNLSATDYSMTFNKPADFLFILDGKDNTRLLTDAYYDRFYYQYTVQKKMFDRNAAFEKENSGLFNTIRTLISNEIDLPLTGETIPPQSYESGLLRFGNANPSSNSYDSLADFYVQGNIAEIRIPWYLLNVMNGCEKTILDNFYQKGGVCFTAGNTILMGMTRLTDSQQSLDLSTYNWQNISQSTYHMRLKQSYTIIRDGFAELMKSYS